MPGRTTTYGELDPAAASYGDLAVGEGRPQTLEQVMLARDTAVLIAHDGRPVALVRPGTYTRTAEGGQRLSGPPEAQEPVQRWFQRLWGDAQFVYTINGQQMVAAAVLLGLPNDEMQAGDTFVEDGCSWEIFAVNADRRYEVRGYCRDIT
jgi:hypothetical protein